MHIYRGVEVHPCVKRVYMWFPLCAGGAAVLGPERNSILQPQSEIRCWGHGETTTGLKPSRLQDRKYKKVSPSTPGVASGTFSYWKRDMSQVHFDVKKQMHYPVIFRDS